VEIIPTVPDGGNGGNTGDPSDPTAPSNPGNPSSDGSDTGGGDRTSVPAAKRIAGALSAITVLLLDDEEEVTRLNLWLNTLV